MERQTDMITCNDGRNLAGVNFYTMMYKIEGVEMFQIIQKSSQSIKKPSQASEAFRNHAQTIKNPSPKPRNHPTALQDLLQQKDFHDCLKMSTDFS